MKKRLVLLTLSVVIFIFLASCGEQRTVSDPINRNNEFVAEPTMYNDLAAAGKDIFIPLNSMKKANESVLISGELPIPEYGYDGIPTIGFGDLDNDDILVADSWSSTFNATYALQYFRMTNVLISDIYVDGDLLVAFSGEFEFQFNRPDIDESIFPIDESKRYIIEGQVGASADMAAGINSKIVMFSCSIYEYTGDEWWNDPISNNYTGNKDPYWSQFTDINLKDVTENSLRFKYSHNVGEPMLIYGMIWSINDDYFVIYGDGMIGSAECRYLNEDPLVSGIFDFNEGDYVWVYGYYQPYEYCSVDLPLADCIVSANKL